MTALSVDSYLEEAERYAAGDHGDGLPVIPPTAAGLAAMVAGSGRAAEEIVGESRVGPSGPTAVTVEDVASVAWMAGCQPRHMPLLLAAFEIIFEADFPLELLVESAGGFFPMLVVNGPIRQSLDVNCGCNVLSPGARTNSTVGRAIRLGLIQFAGATFDAGDKAALGTAFKYACVVGENEEASPWAPFQERQGFAPGESTVTVFAACHLNGMPHLLSGQPDQLVNAFAAELSPLTRFATPDVAVTDACRPQAFLLLGPEHAEHFRDGAWTLEMLTERLDALTVCRAGDVRAAGYRDTPRLAEVDDDAFVSPYGGPGDYDVVVSGSGGGVSGLGGHFYRATRIVQDYGAPASQWPVAADAVPTTPESIDDYVAIVNAYIESGATDGMPVLPPDPEHIAAALDEAGLDGAEIVGTHHFREDPITVRDVTVNAYLAGCKPAHLPIVVAIGRFLFGSGPENWTPSLASVTSWCPMFMVHGPAARDFNHGPNMLGPGSPVNTRVGRAHRLMLMNLGGLKPYLIDKGAIGNPFKYGVILAEEEDGPWGPLHATRGFDPAESAVSIFWSRYPRITLHHEARTPEELLLAVCSSISHVSNWSAPTGRDPNTGEIVEGAAWIDPRPCVACFSEEHRRLLTGNGLTRSDVEDFVIANAGRTVGELRVTGFGTQVEIEPSYPDSHVLPVVRTRDEVNLVAGGGPGGVTMSANMLGMQTIALGGRP